MRAGLMVLGCATLLAGCATKRDLRDLQTEVAALRTAQQESAQATQRQSRMMLDSLNAALVRLRGDLSRQIVGMERQLVQIQELTGQGQQRLAEIREQINTREAQSTAPPQPGGAPPTASAAEAQELFDASLASLRRGSFGTARAGFEEFLRANPQHPLAPDALFYIAEAFAGSKDVARAVSTYDRVIAEYPDHARAAAARTARDRLRARR